MSATIRQIVNDALTIIGEVAGAGVQMYGDDRMRADCIRGFNLMFKKFPWHNYRKWQTFTLDGTTGRLAGVSNTLRQVLDFEDFIAVHRNAETKPLPVLPASINPSVITGSRVLYWTSMHVTDTNYAIQKLQFYPITSVGSVDILAKIYPLVYPATDFDWNDTLYLDRDMLAYSTALMTLAGDDLNAAATGVVREMLDMKYAIVMEALSSHRIPINYPTSVPTDWSVSPY